jgi:TatA/E family protein of Tat protein translocase
MFGLGIQELILILVVALVFIGPKKLPNLARSLGKAMREFRSATDDIKQNFDMDPVDLDPRTTLKPAKPPSSESKAETEKTTENQESNK